ncbi:MAG TPA: hypothetical protein VKV18_08475 [Chthonomonas sp.]|uniref:hypothetical protein n=1 Tax=Chthonomonas sp. TaxID=2282153 RepID=UPI002B4B0DC3|nr:hypothetical protein [Chthonomonas sp.]HLI48705.1 hypothetical protein [Chthonomonas sp.]
MDTHKEKSGLETFNLILTTNPNTLMEQRWRIVDQWALLVSGRPVRNHFLVVPIKDFLLMGGYNVRLFKENNEDIWTCELRGVYCGKPARLVVKEGSIPKIFHES